MYYLKTNVHGKHEILDGDEVDNPADDNYTRFQKHPRTLVWEGPYRPGGSDAVDIIDTSWPDEDWDRAQARVQSFSTEDKTKRRAWMKSLRRPNQF